MPARALPRGFTMVEMIITLAIVGVLAGMSVAALNRLKTRGNFASATGDFIAGLRTARAEAFARGDNTVVIIDAQNGQWWAVEDVNGDFNLSTFSAATPAPLPDRLIMSRTLPDGVSFGPSGGWGQALPVPLSGIPTGFLNLPDGGIASVPMLIGLLGLAGLQVIGARANNVGKRMAQASLLAQDLVQNMSTIWAYTDSRLTAVNNCVSACTDTNVAAVTQYWDTGRGPS